MSLVVIGMVLVDTVDMIEKPGARLPYPKRELIHRCRLGAQMVDLVVLVLPWLMSREMKKNPSVREQSILFLAAM